MLDQWLENNFEQQYDICVENFDLYNLTYYQDLELPITKNSHLNITKVKEGDFFTYNTIYKKGNVKINEPLVFRNLTSNVYSPSFLMEKYGEIQISVSLDKMRTQNNDIFTFQKREKIGKVDMTIEEFFKDLLNNPYESGHFVGNGYLFWEKFSDILSSIELPKIEDVRLSNQLFITHKNKITTLHNHKAAFLLLFHGIKLVTMVDPIYKDLLYCTTSYVDEPLKCSSPINVLNPNMEVHSDFIDVPLKQVLLFPGDILYIPDLWFHHVLSLETSISLSIFIARDEKPAWDPYSELYKSTHCIAPPILAKDNAIDTETVKEYIKDLPVSYSQFQLQYQKDLLNPIIFRGAANDWDYYNFTQLEKKYGEFTIESHRKTNNHEISYPNQYFNISKVKISEYLKSLRKNPKNSSIISNNDKGFWANYSELLEKTHFLDTECYFTSYNFFITPKDTITFLHNHKTTFLALFDGMKLVTLIDKKYKDYIGCETFYKDAPFKCASFLDPITPNLTKYKDFTKAKMKQVIIFAGDVLYIPEYYFHHVISLENSMSISQFISNRQSSDCKK